MNQGTTIRPERPVRPVSRIIDEAPASRKPRILISGEFSAGKTKLITGLVGESVLPSNVTATALPPVWLVSGAPSVGIIDFDGNLRKVSDISDVTMQNAKYCVISHPAKILESFEIIDTPGSSDPNIPLDRWSEMINFADYAIWCTNATQAWRQSEKSFWDELPGRFVGPATVVISHADRMPDEKTADRVLRRVKREADSYFSHFIMASLINDLDVRKIKNHIVDGLIGKIELAGKENKLVQDFSTAQQKAIAPAAQATPAAPVAEAPTARVVVPRRVKPSSTTNVEPPVAEVHHFEPNVAQEAPVSVAQSGFRKLWLEVSSQGGDDPATMLENVEAFLERLESATPSEIARLALKSTDKSQHQTMMKGAKL